MTRILIAILVLGALSGCEKYTEKTSPCFGRSGKPIATKAAYSPTLPFVPVAGHTSEADDCTFRPIGVRV